MDAIFGRNNFRSEIVWNRSAENLSRKKWRRGAETILYYSKSQDWVWNEQFQPLDEKRVATDYRFEDEHGRYTTTSCTNNAHRPNMIYQFNGNRRQWRYSKETMLRYARDGLLVYNKNGIPRRKRYLSEVRGNRLTNVWSDINVLASNARELVGYPTQKPLALYERIIKASSNPGDIVLDPFCGCATTCVAAERQGRQWVGMDIWAGAYGVTIDRIKKEGYLAGSDGARPDLLAIKGQVTYTSDPPRRKDDGVYAVPYLKTIKRTNREPPGPKYSKERMKEILLDENGPVCQGCDRAFDDPRYLQLDHNTPRADYGLNHISNRILLCGPCNILKSNTLTLSGLRRANKKQGFMQERPAGKTRSKPRQRHLSSYEQL